MATAIKGPFSAYSGVDPFPPSYRCNMRYTSQGYLSCGTAGVCGTQKEWQLNSLQSPETSGGHQPYGFDQLAALYARYRVYAVTLDIVLNNPNADGLGMACTIVSSENSGFSTLTGKTLWNVNEQPMSKVYYVNNTGSQVAHFKQYLSMAAIDGKQALVVATDDKYTAPYNDKPAYCPVFRLALGSTDSSHGASQAMSYMLTMTFHCIWTQRFKVNYS